MSALCYHHLDYHPGVNLVLGHLNQSWQQVFQQQSFSSLASLRYYRDSLTKVAGSKQLYFFAAAALACMRT